MDSHYVCTVSATNFHLVAGLRSAGGASRAVLRRALGGSLQPLFGNALWMEYQDLLDRPAWGDGTTAEERRRVLAAWDTENHFRTMAATGDVQTVLAVLDRLDAADGAASAH